jgi:hypothetical protein
MAIKTPLARHHHGLQQKKKPEDGEIEKKCSGFPTNTCFNIGLPVGHQQTNGRAGAVVEILQTAGIVFE